MDKETKKAFVENLEEGLSREEIMDIEKEWTLLQNTIQTSAQKCETTNVRRVIKDWFDEECKEALERRNRARIRLLKENTEENMQIHNEERRRAKQVCRLKKRKHAEDMLHKIENSYVNK